MELTVDTAKIIFSKFKNLDSVPDMEKINGWHRGMDGISYLVEYSTKKSYFFRSYWTPKAQGENVPYKKEILNFIQFIDDDLNIKRHYDAFINTLPPGNYTDGFFNISIGKKKK